MGKKSVTPRAQKWTDPANRSSVVLALDRIEAAAWLLDQTEVGELSFLRMGQDVPTWLSVVTSRAEDLSATLTQWAITAIGEAVREIRQNLPPETEASAAPAGEAAA